MKKILTICIACWGISLGSATAQCITLTCPADSIVYLGSGACDVQVSYPAPGFVVACPPFAAVDTFQFTGSMQMCIIPPNVDTVEAEVWGAQGGANWVNNDNFGGFVQGKFPVVGGDTLFIYVGGQPNGLAGGFNGGGAGDAAGQGGGGGTDIRFVDNDLNSRVLVAGGGGGAGYWSNLHVVGGQGGGLAGGDGYRNTVADPGGLGASQVGPGPSGTCINFGVPAMAGGFGFGGTPAGSNCGCEGYGGGGGWYGGAGSGNCRGGGGGSGYAAPSVVDTIMLNGARSGNGLVVVRYMASVSADTNLIAGLPSGSSFPLGATVQTFQGYNNIGDTVTCSFTITVLDTLKPQFGCPVDLVSDSSIVHGIGLSNVTDNCGFTTVFYSLSGTTTGTGSGDASGTAFNPGLTTVTYVVADSSGNIDSCSFTVTYNPLGTGNQDLPSVAVYPNPADDVLMLDLRFAEPVDQQVLLMSATGKVIRELTLKPGSTHAISISDIAPGSYYLSLNGVSVQPVIIY